MVLVLYLVFNWSHSVLRHCLATVSLVVDVPSPVAIGHIMDPDTSSTEEGEAIVLHHSFTHT